ncbi:hypothetical protein DL93DRAFT_2168936 [Clavulina sp. PMI_390]|nr:hypothetical protein DL93DRAFT_2168936 [Clavulina sp. PMI_390]
MASGAPLNSQWSVTWKDPLPIMVVTEENLHSLEYVPSHLCSTCGTAYRSKEEHKLHLEIVHWNDPHAHELLAAMKEVNLKVADTVRRTGFIESGPSSMAPPPSREHLISLTTSGPPPSEISPPVQQVRPTQQPQQQSIPAQITWTPNPQHTRRTNAQTTGPLQHTASGPAVPGPRADYNAAGGHPVSLSQQPLNPIPGGL